VPGIGYDLISATKPDPTQVISLSLDLPESTPAAGDQTPEPTPVPTFKVGDTIPLKTGMILDRNRHVVPDGTPVRFLFTTGGEQDVAQSVDTVTSKGVARASYLIERSGLLDISATSDPAPIRPPTAGYHGRGIGSYHCHRADSIADRKPHSDPHGDD
jgi:beta-N-acetylhexosaminidase